jgi:ATP-binding cassette subfamily B protein
MKKIKSEQSAYRKQSAAPAALTAISVLAGLGAVLVNIAIIALLWDGEGQNRVIALGLTVLLLQIAKAVFNSLALWQAHEGAYSALFSIRSALIDHLKKLPLSFFQRRKTGNLAGVVDHDVERVEIYLAHTLPEVLSTILVCALSFIALAVVNWRFALIVIAAVAAVGLIMGISTPFWKGSVGAYQDSMREVSSGIMEYISTISVIKAFRAGEGKTQEVLASIEDYIIKARKSICAQTIPMGLVSVFVEGSVAAVAVFGCYLLSQSDSIAGSAITRFILAIILTGMFAQNMMKVPTLLYNKTVYDHTMKAVDDIMQEPVSSVEKSGKPAAAGDVVFKDAGFSYDGGEAALTDVSVIFGENTTSAIVGPSGAGKSTIAGLLLGFWKHDVGSITIAGKPIETIPEDELTALITVVQQDTFLLNISIAENIRIGKPDASDEEVVEAAKKAQIHDTIISLPRAYQSAIGEGGAKLSGGEKQRISLARMILKDAPILILDEATAAIDPYNEALIQTAIANLCENKTLIVIAHRLATIKNAEQIIVLDKGRVQAAGRHADLMEACDLYRDMWAAQNEAENWSIRGGGAI